MTAAQSRPAGSRPAESGATQSGATQSGATQSGATQSGATQSGATQSRSTQSRPAESRATRTPPSPSRPAPRRPVRIANSSGFYGDRATAAREMVEGGPIDVLTGDYLAELTMLILWKAQQKDPATGYARTVLAQLEHVLGTCLDRGIKIVNNAGGLNPAGLAREFGALAERLGLHPQIAYVTGDDLLPRLHQLLSNGEALAHLDTGQPLSGAVAKPVTANAYLGGWGITAALDAGADLVVCPRVTDASLVTGPAAWWHGWRREDFDQLAGAVLAGHVIECGPQATGGNYSFLDEITDRRYPGFPIAEVAADGSSVITKHPDTGGLVSPGTVTAQLLYEIAGPGYANPDVVAHFDTVTLGQDGPDRVRLSGTRGSPPPATAKVAINFLGGYRNTMTLVLTGLDIEDKAAWAEQELFGILGGREQFADIDVRLLRFDRPDAPTNEQATAHLRITVKDPDPRKVGRRFSNATMELALGGYAGFHTTTPPTPESAYGVYWPALVPAAEVPHAVVLPDGTAVPIPGTAPAPAPAASASPGSAVSGPAVSGPAVSGPAVSGPAVSGPAVSGPAVSGPAAPEPVAPEPAAPAPAAAPDGPAVAAPLGRICAARSGDKGGSANIGIWARDPAAYPWLRDYLTVGRLRTLLPECAPLEVRRFELPNLSALNFVIIGLLGEGVAASARPDPQAKGLGEYLRSRTAEIPAALLDRGGS
jgi:Acyclic terpene utilisation family protein AtuA